MKRIYEEMMIAEKAKAEMGEEDRFGHLSKEEID
jgi:hypothetical protein